MTSMPASRSARAITLAPRSWPSRPGLATKTRIFGSAIVHHLTTADTGITEVWTADELWSFHIQTLPQIPARYAAVRFPTFGNLFHYLRLGKFALVVMFLDCCLHSVVSRGQHVLALQREHQKHLRCPHPDTFDLRQVLDNVVVRQLRQARKIEHAGRGLGREVLQVC